VIPEPRKWITVREIRDAISHLDDDARVNLITYVVDPKLANVGAKFLEIKICGNSHANLWIQTHRREDV